VNGGKESTKRSCLMGFQGLKILLYGCQCGSTTASHATTSPAIVVALFIEQHNYKDEAFTHYIPVHQRSLNLPDIKK